MHKHAEKIAEMAAVMNQVAVMDEESSVRDLESMSQLITENRVSNLIKSQFMYGALNGAYLVSC